jgi:tripartite-type tricarboxylate transporter receptor subunit TctC
VVPVSSPEAFAVHPSRPRDLHGFLAAMAGKDITYATAGVGSGSHIAAEYFLKVHAKAQPVHVPFRGGAPSVQAALGNQVDMVAASFGIVPQAVDGQLSGLAVASATRLEAMPNVPTFTELGFPFEAASWVGVFVPEKTSPQVIEMLNAAINEIVMNDDVRQKLASQGYLRHQRNRAETQAYVAAEVDKWRMMINAVGITAE